MTPATPPDWPAEVPPPESGDFPDRAVAWLLDQAPPEFRQHPVFRAHPGALARVTSHYAEGALQASRAAYAGARRELVEPIGQEAVEGVLRALEHEGVRLRRLVAQIARVEEALLGRRWVERL